jgi:hypothetical protein
MNLHDSSADETDLEWRDALCPPSRSLADEGWSRPIFLFFGVRLTIWDDTRSSLPFFNARFRIGR